MPFQSIQSVDTEKKEVTVSSNELIANWRCAASLARKERMYGTADRLETDADQFLALYGRDSVLTIKLAEVK